MKKIRLLFFLVLLLHVALAQTKVFDATRNIYDTNANNGAIANIKVDSTISQVNIDCGAGGKFWTVAIRSGCILEWQLSGATITFLDTLFATSPVFSLAYCNLLNAGSISTTLYGSNLNNVCYYNGITWDSIATTQTYGNVGGYGRFLYYMGNGNTDIVRYNGITFDTIVQLHGTSFAVADIAVDTRGVAWSMIARGITTDSLVAFDSTGTLLKTYIISPAINTNGAYGCFMIDSTFYIGIDDFNPNHPNTLLPIVIYNDSAIVGSPIPFVSDNFGDMASCLNSVMNLPVANFTSAEKVICVDNCINFTNASVSATSWQWGFTGGSPLSSTDENPQVCYLTTGIYNVTLIASNSTGCDTIDNINYITVDSAPSTPTITHNQDTLYCSTNPTYISYQWYHDSTLISGATDSLLLFTQSGNYNVKVTNNNGCSIAVGINVVGIKELSANNYFTLSPNPATDQLLITSHWKSESSQKKLTVFNVLGEIIYTQIFNIEQQIINCKPFLAGVYFVQVSDDTQRVVLKFVKE